MSNFAESMFSKDMQINERFWGEDDKASETTMNNSSKNSHSEGKRGDVQGLYFLL